jgi:hypothetical protein
VFTDADHSKLDAIEASADVTDTTNVVAALTAGTNVTIGGDGTISSTAAGTDITKVESQSSHGFAVGDLVYDNAGTWTKAQADDPTTADVIGIVTAVDTDDFDLTTAGYVSGLTGLTANSAYFLSDATAGLLTATEPTATGSVSKPVFSATSTTTGYFINYRGMTIASSVALTPLATATASASSELLFDGVFTDTYDVYEIHFVDINVATDGAELRIFPRTGVPADETGTQQYYNRSDLMNGTYSSSGANGNSNRLCANIGNNTDENASGQIKIFPRGTSYTSWNGTFYRRNSSNNRYRQSVAGVLLTASVIDGVRCAASSGNLASGKIHVYGYNIPT